MPDQFVIAKKRPVRLWDVPLALLAPRRIFSRVENIPRYTWPLFVLLTLMTLIGYATIETGLIDRQVAVRVDRKQAELEKIQVDVVERSALNKELEDVRKAGEFDRLMTRLAVVVAQPALILASALLTSAILFGVVALTGRKPEWHTIMTVVVFASFVDLIAQLFRLGLMLQHATLAVDTSASLLLRAIPEPLSQLSARTVSILEIALGGIEPFRIWFWCLVWIGMVATMQLRGWRAWSACFLLWFTTTLGHVGWAFSSTMSGPPPGA